MIDLLAGIPLWVVFVPITMAIAYFKGRRLVLWGVLGYFGVGLGVVNLTPLLQRNFEPLLTQKCLKSE